MRRAGLIGVAAAVLFAIGARAGCDYTPRFSGQFRSSALDVFASGTDLWIADSYGVVLYDRSVDPPRPSASLSIPGTTAVVTASGEYAYAGSGSLIYAIRKSGMGLQREGSADAGGTVNDMLAVPPYLFVATATGLRQFDTLVPGQPAPLGGRLPTTAGGAFSLAAKDEFLYAADGDATIDVFSIQVPALPQPVGTLASLPRASSVRVLGDRLLVSDGQQTEIFAGSGINMVRIGSAAGIGASSVAGLDARAGYMAGNDRQLRAVDFRDATVPVTLWQYPVPFSAGTVNRITAMAPAPDRLYVSAGDTGLLTFDTSAMKAPYPIRAHSVGAQRSVFSFGNVVVSAASEGGLRQYAQSDIGVLTFQRKFEEQRVWAVHDGKSMRLLASSGSTLYFWDLVPSPPLLVSSASMRASVRGAVLAGSGALVLLSDRSVWSVDVSQESPVPVQVSVAAASPSFIAHSGDAVALADLNDDGTSTVRYFPDGNLTAAPQAATLTGAATSGIAVSQNGKIAAVTFAGILTADFRTSPPTVGTVSAADPRPAVALQFAGTELLVLRSGALEVWDPEAKLLKRTLTLPGTAAAMYARADAGSSIASVATDDGLASVLFASVTSVPSLIPASPAAANHYYRRMSGAEGRLYFFDGKVIDSMTLRTDGLPLSTQTIAPSGTVVDFAPLGSVVFALDGSGKITGYDADGHAVASYQLQEGADVNPLRITPVAGALWVSISRGCLTTGCVMKTIVLDPRGAAMLRAAELDGAVVDVDVSAGRAYALFETPDEIRIIDVSNPFAPIVAGSRASEGNPVSIAWSAARSTVFTLGARLYGYSVPSLTRVFEALEEYAQDPSRRLSYVDQRLRIDGDCAVIAGRRYAPQIYSVGESWTALPALNLPEAVRSLNLQNGRIYFLSDYSLEILSSRPPAKRKRAL